MRSPARLGCGGAAARNFCSPQLRTLRWTQQDQSTDGNPDRLDEQFPVPVLYMESLGSTLRKGNVLHGAQIWVILGSWGTGWPTVECLFMLLLNGFDDLLLEVSVLLSWPLLCLLYPEIEETETEKLWWTEQTFHSGNFKFWLAVLHSSKQHGKNRYFYVSKGFETILKHPGFDSILPATWVWNMRKVCREYRRSDDSKKEMDCVLLKNQTYPNMQE